MPKSQTARLRIALLTIALCLPSAFASGQGAGNGNGNGTGNGNNNNGNAGSGILIDAEGVVRPNRNVDRTGKLNRKRSEAFAAEHLDEDLQTLNEMRLVSLPALEEAYAAAMDAGNAPSPDVQYMAGLQRIDFVFIDPERNDVVLAGPAEGFAPDEVGRMRGLTTGRPPIRIEDLIVALRSIFSGEDFIGCSIDPEQGRLAALQRWVAANSSPTSSSGARRRYTQMANILGLEDVSLWGVPQDSHYARVLVEADYTMKRIALGAEPSGVRGIRSHLSMLKPNGNSMQRWWFAPYYEAIHSSEDGTAYQITGQRVQLLSQEEHVSAGGNRSNSAFTRMSTQQFAKRFTDHFPELAEKNPVFAQLQNLFDLAVVAAILKDNGVLEWIDWPADVFLNRASLESYPVARHVPSAATTRPARGGVMLGLIGGVTMRPSRIVKHQQVQGSEEAQVAAEHRVRVFASPTGVDSFWRD